MADNRTKIKLMVSNQKDRKLIQNLLSGSFTIFSDNSVNFKDCDLLIFDLGYFKEYKSRIKKLKADKNAFTPVICLKKEKDKAAQYLFEIADDVINLPVSKNILLARAKNLVKNKKLYEENRALKNKYRYIFDSLNDMVFLLDIVDEKDRSFKISEINNKLLKNLKYDNKSLKNESPEKFMSDEGISELIRVIDKNEETLFTADFYTGRGNEVPVKINAQKIWVKGNQKILCAARDITDRKEKEERINYLLFHDHLTKLYNRRFFEEEMIRLDTERQLPLCIFIIDINGMKLINDSFGHKYGDELLVKTADLLQDVFRKEDILARWGGDEFSILLPKTGESEAEDILSRIKEKCKKTESDRLPVSLGVGYAVKEDKDQDIFEVLNEADDRMYQDKLTAQKSATNKILKSLLSSLEAKSPETEAHTNRLAVMAIKLGERIGLSNNQLNNLSLLATLHDIGKVNISEDILTKPENLNEEEWERIKEHPHIGYKIALSCDDFSSVADEILAHHERWDGGGYPEGLQGDDIPLLSRIISIVDAYDVMANGRPYKEPMSRKEVLQELERCAGSQFDPRLVAEFIDMAQNDEL
ncbi:sensor domain-containing diguanylate cyclase/phosphohydrolase [Halarsenatibacter silvermanii]|uniref:PAS domain S-box-containing protein/diguanylate cyclase (GGDEF) domain-containing protein n=1 Tax=Halarsenatibacter silvermanii TaxID=321763 RepID=A0A1G9PSH3_9FIRM|nr:diguanylate cyclase [Halarsenatibacter silvermanii]SDM01734.1 PAS domain S-box-containing protein/diguanylate cyclase (GGDEF) domain-containing protein [Halarsenatibacter silvermanii]